MRLVLVGIDHPEVVACEARLRRAQLAADVSTLDVLLAEDLLFTGPDGQLGTKAQDLAAHGSGAVRFLAHTPEELRIRQAGADVAVAALRAHLMVEVSGTIQSGTYRYTRVWQRDVGGSWRVAGGHVSEVAAGGQPASSDVEHR